jgi:hypothetical protein
VVQTLVRDVDERILLIEAHASPVTPHLARERSLYGVPRRGAGEVLIAARHVLVVRGSVDAVGLPVVTTFRHHPPASGFTGSGGNRVIGSGILERRRFSLSRRSMAVADSGLRDRSHFVRNVCDAGGGQGGDIAYDDGGGEVPHARFDAWPL